ncbi:DUF3427 domain-containing protein [Kytococcus sedentarius]|uniref:DUF3427 domain-containing protein n=1 Tax=Kytococcus sedentarius TaxID=1276 RepID=UPI00194E6496|nr:DUF3427 domain-containing protein [Kytococcus sedentarius]QRO86615.1 DUF3427 domain-containing protein [Kytococcus sedentarius]
MSEQDLPQGFYDQLLTQELAAKVQASPWTARVEDIPDAESAERGARHIAAAVAEVLRSRPAAERSAVVDRLVDFLGAERQLLGPQGFRRLVSLVEESRPGQPPRYEARPSTPLSDAALLTNAEGEPSVGREIASEMLSADRVDLLCAFIKFEGLRTMERELKRLKDLRIPFRVITTTYMGATDARAIARLVEDFGAQVKVHYESRQTRLHAKAWMFHRDTSFHTAYVGSSNLSRSALVDGVEWNVRLSHHTTPHLLEKFRATFETYWNDESFETFDPSRDADRLHDALAEASGRSRGTDTVLDLSGLAHRPYPFQQVMLDALEAERVEHDRHRNLLVAATGTGKTVVAAFDYKRLCEATNIPRRLLFVAHRWEILVQARRTYREILGDGTFGEMLGRGEEPRRWEHVFATVQSLTAERLGQLPRDHFDVVVIDEFHHAQAATYRRLLTALQPAELLGLTATPERADGVDVRQEFFGGRAAHELRLWDALSEGLLTPFHYFGVHDNTDLSAVAFTRGRYDAATLESLYTGNDARVLLVLKAVRDKVLDPRRMRAIGFCVGVQHAQFMARKFTEAGIPARAVTGESNHDERSSVRRDLHHRKINVVFTADLYNEGVDLPEVDTVLFLRPTESSTIFLQQLGRGLRRHHDKAVLTALDFVGHQHANFRLEQRFTAMTGLSRQRLADAAEHGFPFLPSGTQIVLDDVAQEELLRSIRESLHLTRRHLLRELGAQGALSLQSFSQHLGVPPEAVLKRGAWTSLRREAGLVDRPATTAAPETPFNASDVLHVDDMARIHGYRLWLSSDAPRYSEASPRQQTYGRMLQALLLSRTPSHGLEADLAELSQNPMSCAELLAGLEIAEGSIHRIPQPLGGRLSTCGMQSHATYTRAEILAALGLIPDAAGRTVHQSGVAYSQQWEVDALLTTLVKSDATFSPTTMYRDYALSPTRFHWESQSATSPGSPTGQRYIHHERRGSTILMFVRQNQKTEWGAAEPFVLLGTARFVETEGAKPMQVVWDLDRPMPTEVYQHARAVA